MKDSMVGAARDFFGTKEGQKLTGFAAELKELSPQARFDIASGLFGVGAMSQKGLDKETERATQAGITSAGKGY